MFISRLFWSPQANSSRIFCAFLHEKTPALHRQGHMMGGHGRMWTRWFCGFFVILHAKNIQKYPKTNP